MIRFYQLKTEPLIKSTSASRRQPFARGTKFDDMEILAYSDELESILWRLNMPEQILCNQTRLHFQVGMDWQEAGGGWYYQKYPVRNLLGVWDKPQGRLNPFSESQRPIIGEQGANVWVDSRGLHYEVSIKNTSDEAWRDVSAWICLMGSLPLIAYRPYCQLNQNWVPFQDIPNISSHCYLPVQGMEAEYYRSGVGGSQEERDPISFPGVVAWNFVDRMPLLICHFSEDAVAVGANQNNPCTDLFLWYGNLPPGKEISKRGHLVVANSDLATFKNEGFFNTVKYGGEDNLTLFSRQTPPVSGKNAEKHL